MVQNRYAISRACQQQWWPWRAWLRVITSPEVWFLREPCSHTALRADAPHRFTRSGQGYAGLTWHEALEREPASCSPAPACHAGTPQQSITQKQAAGAQPSANAVLPPPNTLPNPKSRLKHRTTVSTTSLSSEPTSRYAETVTNSLSKALVSKNPSGVAKKQDRPPQNKRLKLTTSFRPRCESA